VAAFFDGRRGQRALPMCCPHTGHPEAGGNMAGITAQTNVPLGFMLGMTRAIGHFIGRPVDVRHVILSRASAPWRAPRWARWFGGGAFLSSVTGMAVMFVLHLSVHFLLALASAARAYEQPARNNTALVRGRFRRFRRAPLDVFVPPRPSRANDEATVRSGSIFRRSQ
jgi:site-specific recombinase